jgi:tRNA-2-methylthio-N6-dimethylallyladenosine synthase
VQSGSDRVLALMKRTYTREWFSDTVKRLKDAVPDLAISTDIIVGYPGETDRDFEETMDLMREVEFESSFSFKFSPRPGTPAAGLPEEETVPDETAGTRLRELQAFQKEITLRKNMERVGKTEEVLVEGPSKHDPESVSGRTSHNRIANFRGPASLVGSVVRVRVSEGLSNSIRGELSV